MHYIWTIARYDQIRRLKARETYLIGLLMPGLMMFILGLAISGSSATITIDVIDEDGSALAQQFVSVLRDEMTADNEDSQAFLLCPYTGGADQDCGLENNVADQPDRWQTTADDRLKNTDTFGVVFIEQGFGEKLRAGEPVTVTFKSSSDLSAPTLAEQTINAAVSRMGGSVAIANLTVAVAEDVFGPFEPARRADAFDRVRADVEDAWTQRPVRVEEQATKEDASLNGFNQSGPGIATMFVLMFLLNGSTMLVFERETGTLQRLLTLPIHRSRVLAGKILGNYIYGLGMFAVLIGVGAMMGSEWGADVIGIALIVLAFTLAATALGLALATVVRTSAQAQSISLLMGLTLAPLGGAWWPLEIVPDFMKIIGHISPIAWAMDAFHELMWYDGTVIDILPMIGVLLGMAAVFFVFGAWNFKYE
jgi:ABC-2 type transport system permease protein